MRRGSFPILLLLLAAVAGSGCGTDDDPAPATTATTAPRPALARRAPAPGEIVVRGEASPGSHGPYDFDAVYLVRFEQYAPEDPRLDFATQTPLSAALLEREGDTRGAIPLFEEARRAGRRNMQIRGRYVVDVSFGDFPYVIRFTPQR